MQVRMRDGTRSKEARSDERTRLDAGRRTTPRVPYLLDGFAAKGRRAAGPVGERAGTRLRLFRGGAGAVTGGEAVDDWSTGLNTGPFPLASLRRIGASTCSKSSRIPPMWLIPSFIVLLGVIAAAASHPPAPVLVAFAPEENPATVPPSAEKSVARALKKAALKRKTPAGRPSPSPPADRPPQLRPSPETAPM